MNREVVSEEIGNQPDRKNPSVIFEMLEFSIRIITGHFKILLTASALTLVAVYAFTFILPVKYRAEAVLLRVGENSSSIISDILPTGDLTALAGRIIGNESILQLYPIISLSDFILSGAMSRPYREESEQTLLQVYMKNRDVGKNDHETRGRVLKRLRKDLFPQANTRIGTFTLGFEHSDPEFAAAVVNTIVSEMDEYFREKLDFESTSKRLLIERRMVEVQDSLSVSEESLKVFRQSNRMGDLSPELRMIEGRLIREVEIYNAIFVELNRQYELAKIQEAGETPIVNVLDWAPVPWRVSSPRRVYLSFVTALLVFLLLFCRFTVVNIRRME